MISVTVFQKDGQFTGFLCQGHAGYAEEGYDIVCSAVSALTLNTVNSLEAFTEDGMKVEQKEDGGYLKLELTGEISGEADLLMRSLILGLQTIEESCGSRFLTVEIEPWQESMGD